MVPSKRLYLLLLLGMAISPVIAILFNQSISLIILALFDFILCSLAIWDGITVKPNRVKITRHPLNKLSIGRDNNITFLVESSKQKANIILRDNYPSEFTVSPPTLSAKIEPNKSQELTYIINPNKRGEFQWGNIQVRQLGKWRLTWHQWQISASQQVAVYPDLIGLRSLSIRLALENTGTIRQNRPLGIGTEFSELREYGIGDDTRLIDWKATARRSRPLVRVLEPETEQTLIILLDRGRLMTAQVQGLKRFDWGLNATLSLALTGLSRGDRVGVGVFDRQVSTWIPPERGQYRLSKLVESLTPIQPVLLEADYVGAVSRVVNQQSRRALIVMITDIVDRTASGELLSALAKLTPRYLPFCVTLRDPLVDKLAHAETFGENQQVHEKISAAYSRGVAIDLLCQREVAFAELKQKGVLVLDAPANQISTELVDRYLQLKSRNLL
ncbi:DUF58 domain-containing protein [Okeania sp.]|uniref:DUF58 domain-containing protein n=1 Tax=Okeania sp. TaxID=3100323 RepID=UPI002B4B0EFA|nr:DUF58 domain-containing protein [Okeania sp.]MEB3340400.1 DUF58 domain-containing protein [Okeania sp.]